MRPQGIKRLTDAGWRFEWHRDAQFVACVHPLGGKQSLVHVMPVPRNGFDRDEIGQAIAGMLNGAPLGDLLDAVRQCIEHQQRGMDVLASDAWDRVRAAWDKMEAE